MLYGYARVSSADQSVDLQVEQLRNAGCDIVRAEKVSGTSREGREELERLLDFVRDGDVLVVTRLDRLARSVPDLWDIMRALNEKGAKFRPLDQPSLDTSTPHGQLLLTILGAIAQFETQLRGARQREAIAKAKAEGRYKGRPPKVNTEKGPEIDSMLAKGLGPTHVARALGIGRASVYRYIKTKKVVR